jgi:hypothetical protein
LLCAYSPLPLLLLPVLLLLLLLLGRFELERKRKWVVARCLSPDVCLLTPGVAAAAAAGQV